MAKEEDRLTTKPCEKVLTCLNSDTHYYNYKDCFICQRKKSGYHKLNAELASKPSILLDNKE